ncbi:MAG: replication initiation protein [Bacteroidetes bacterium]|nr:replication initiation protein [Bacteroidota bacterium]
MEQSQSQLKLSFKAQNKLIRQHNGLTGAKYNLTPIQKDIIYLLLSQIKEIDEPDKIYKFHISALYTKNRRGVNYTRIKEDIDELLKQKIEIKKLTGWLKFPAVVSSIEYVEKEGMFELEISSKLRPYLFNLKNNFTTFWSETALNIKSTHAKRIYEMLSQYKDTGFLKISIRDLKERLYLINHIRLQLNFPSKTLKIK